MTAISDTATRAKPADRLLRVVLKIDAIASGLTGLGFVGTPAMFKDFYGLPSSVAIPTGVFLIVFAIGVWVVGARRQLNATAVKAIIVLNLAWVAATAVVLVTGALPLTTLGVGYAIVQAIAVAALAELEFIGMRRVGR